MRRGRLHSGSLRLETGGGDAAAALGLQQRCQPTGGDALRVPPVCRQPAPPARAQQAVVITGVRQLGLQLPAPLLLAAAAAAELAACRLRAALVADVRHVPAGLQLRLLPGQLLAGAGSCCCLGRARLRPRLAAGEAALLPWPSRLGRPCCPGISWRCRWWCCCSRYGGLEVVCRCHDAPGGACGGAVLPARSWRQRHWLGRQHVAGHLRSWLRLPPLLLSRSCWRAHRCVALLPGRCC